MTAAAAIAEPASRAVPLASTPVDVGAIVSAIADAMGDPRPFDPWRLDARDPAMVRALLPLFTRIARDVLRVEIEGLEHVRRHPALFAANHDGGALGADLVCTLSLLWRELGPDAPLYGLAHDFAMRRVTPLGRVLQRAGAVRAHPESARRVLRRGGSLLVSAGGDLDACRAFGKKRDRVAVGDRAGFVRIARDAGVPIIPIVAQGTHRSALIVREAARLAEAVGLRTWSNLERVPIARAFARMPAASPRAPYRGVPFKVRLRVLPPIVVPRRADCDAMRALLVDRMQAALDELAAR